MNNVRCPFLLRHIFTLAHSRISIFKLLISSCSLFILCSCSVNYSFTGASISPDTKTFSVAYIQNNAAVKNAALSDIITEGLKDKMRSSAGLTLVNANGDLQFEGAITDYTTTFQGVTAAQVAAQYRFTISVRVKFTNTKDETKSFEKTFSQFRDYPVSENFASIEDALIRQITEEIIDAIFMDAVANW
ncbi:MAG: LPS assembly lipoprotein LptE [Bacteroidales bacterium]|nr:LPS assembly lipoprotein LptE [Bacteroidales bacterium]